MIALETTWVPDQEDFDLFARVSGDDNPIHVDPDFAAGTAFGRTVSHGMLIYAKLWGMVRGARPEGRTLRQEITFPNPAYAGEAMRLTVTGALPGLVEMHAERTADGAALFVGTAEVS